MRELAQSELDLVTSIAKGYAGHGLEFPALIQAGVAGLLEAGDATKAQHFEGNTPNTAWWIRQAIMRAIKDHKRS